jgi:hypothetical protein
MDQFLVPSALSDACLIKVGVLSSVLGSGSRPPSESEHWPVVAEFNFESVLGIDGEDLQVCDEVMRTKSSVKIDNKRACGQFAEDVTRRWRVLNLERRIAEMEVRDDTHSDDYFTNFNKNIRRHDDGTSRCGPDSYIEARWASTTTRG